MAAEVALLVIPSVVTEWFCLPVAATLDSFLCKPVQVGVSLTCHSTANVKQGTGVGC